MKSTTFIVMLIFVIFFVISFLTNILAPLIPDVIRSFDLSVGLAGFLPFSFFAAYGIMSVPAGLIIEKTSEKTVLTAAFMMAFFGALCFALFPGFYVAMASLFVIGLGMAMLQVVINPLLRETGGDKSFAFNSVLAQLFFGGASILSPLLYSYLVMNIHSDNSSTAIQLLNLVTPSDMGWISLYWIFALISFLMIIIIVVVRFPKVALNESERMGTGEVLRPLLSNRFVVLFFIGIFAYVGTEQGISNWISQFLQTYHQTDPATQGAKIISSFWLLLTIGCLLGLVLLKLLDSRKVLILFSLGAMASLAVALFGTAEASLYAFPLTGFFLSVMWSVIVSLALNSVPHHHGTLSGILCTGVVGGAIVPLFIGGVAELIGLRLSMCFNFVTLAYILSIGLWAKPLVNNATVKNFKDLFRI